jgi:adenine-specific DNA methylase
MNGPRRLIEVDLPIGWIGIHGRREKHIQHRHIGTLSKWWARRPLAACRAVVLAALWPDPADPACPGSFRAAAAAELAAFGRERGWKARDWNDPEGLRQGLLDFLSEFAAWEHSARPEFLRLARNLTAAAHQALGGDAGARPLVVDPFAGGGAIPLEALRVGADAFASDLNPVAVLLNKVVLEYVPRFGAALAEAVREWGGWVKEQANRELAAYYPSDADGSVPIAYIWCRTVTCEGPGCGTVVPLMRAPWLSKKGRNSVALELVPDRQGGGVDFRLREGSPGSPLTDAQVGGGTVRRGSATCPVCGYTTPVVRVRAQLKARRGGAADARLVAVVTTHPARRGRSYRLPMQRDLAAVAAAREELSRRGEERLNGLPAVPDEPFPVNDSRAFTPGVYGITTWGELFTPRQLLALTTLSRLVREAIDRVRIERGEEFARAVGTCLACTLNRCVDRYTSLTPWDPGRMTVTHTCIGNALQIIWDFAEVNPCSGSMGGWESAVNWVAEVCMHNAEVLTVTGQALAASATRIPLPDGIAQVLITDPPYYDAVPYGDLSDFFYIWLRRTVGDLHCDLFRTLVVPKGEECIVNLGCGKDKQYFELTMERSLSECRRVLADNGIGVVVFANQSTSGWEALLGALIDAGWTVMGSWPIDTERSTRLRAHNSAALASSVHLVCRPRTAKEVGDWRDVLAQLPGRVHQWLPRLAAEGIVGADAVFACLGPALEVFSRYDRVEKASGEAVPLGEYLEQVWAAVSREALGMIFTGADASGLEEDSRLTAMWLWTLLAGKEGLEAAEADEDEEEVEAPSGNGKARGFALEYDTARKIAQGLGAHLEVLGKPGGIVEVRGDTARLLPVRERARALFGRAAAGGGGERASRGQPRFAFDTAPGAPRLAGELSLAAGGEITPGTSVLDRLHQAMLLFGAGGGDTLRRFLNERGAGATRASGGWPRAFPPCILREARRSAGWTGCSCRRRTWAFERGGINLATAPLAHRRAAPGGPAPG